MSTLLDKLRRAREFKVQAAGFTFTVLRPTDVDYLELAGQKTARAILPFIIGWEGVTEGDIIPGGDPHPLPFDGEACREWLLDRMDILPALIDAFIKAHEAHVEARASAEKK